MSPPFPACYSTISGDFIRWGSHNPMYDVKKVYFLVEPPGVVRSPRGCEKWNLYKLLHRSSGPKIFPTFFFHRKNIILKMGKIFFWKIWFFITEFWRFPFKLCKWKSPKLSYEKWDFPKKCFPHFQNYIFSMKKKGWEIFRITRSM